jgi:hypothetical protein
VSTYTNNKTLKSIAGQVSALAADMRAFNEKRGRPAAATFTIEQLAISVLHSDRYNSKAGPEDLAHILEIALKTRVGVAALGGRPVRIDLGNGHYVECRVRPFPGVAA